MATATEILERVLNESNNSIDTSPQDLTTPDVFLKAIKQLSTFTLSGIQIRGSFTLNVVAGHTAVATNWVCIQQTDPEFNILRFFQAQIITANATTLIIDSPIDFIFDPAKVNCSYIGRANLAGDTTGTTTTPALYKITPTYGAWHITRMMIQMFSTTAMDDGKLGSITKLINGITIQRRNDFWYNSFNFKSNGDLAGISYDTKYADKPPAGTGYGFSCRLTFKNLGIVKSLESAAKKGHGEDDSLVVIVPNPIGTFGTGGTFHITFEGHIVED